MANRRLTSRLQGILGRAEVKGEEFLDHVGAKLRSRTPCQGVQAMNMSRRLDVMETGSTPSPRDRENVKEIEDIIVGNYWVERLSLRV
ncbi:hypothetical protein CPLU01_11367 [Colletotrichum plurivorum]|uniref:Uncharacterized protein n=1 Tax=Colletotrichum plurivorum TaxID=2175906 RepID=A0A8H6K2E8_9PEZI|nr:hypothetical protein CPLU01_11367 [Colletotrichum plurivorum]